MTLAPHTVTNRISPKVAGHQCGIRAIRSGLKAEPSITPITIVMGGRMTGGAATGSFPSAASVQNSIGPIIQGRGMLRRWKSNAPARPRASASMKRR